MTQSTQSSPMPEGTPSLRTIAMPADTNPAGDIFGGWIMSQLDISWRVCGSHRQRAGGDRGGGRDDLPQACVRGG